MNADERSLSALLSQLLVAFTVEFDNEFERRMYVAGRPGERLSLMIWANLIRFLAVNPISVRALAAQALAPEKQVRLQLGCLERWGIVLLHSNPAGPRDGWGSARGRAGSMVSLTSKGILASEIWPPLFDLVERRWEQRFGTRQMLRLRRAMNEIEEKLESEMPLGLPEGWEGPMKFPPRVRSVDAPLPFPTLFSRLLLAFQLEFDAESPLQLMYCANTLRVLSEEPVRIADLPFLTGISPETSAIGWRVRPYVVVKADPAARRGKVVGLSPRGLQVQQAYHRLVGEIERRWETRFGKERLIELRQSLQGFFDRNGDDSPLLSEGLIAPEGTARHGSDVPALGRRLAGTASRQRTRDLVAQTEAFVRDPARTLPHFPAWDINRGFGP